MVDIMLTDGDNAVNSAGEYVKLSGRDAEFQRALICIKAKLGEFIYNRELGSAGESIGKYEENAGRRIELVLNEALSKFENVSVEVLEYGNILRVKIIVDGEKRMEEIVLNG